MIHGDHYYSFEVNDNGDYVDSFTLSLLCNSLLKKVNSNKRVIPIQSQDQSSVNLYLDLNIAYELVREFELDVIFN